MVNAAKPAKRYSWLAWRLWDAGGHVYPKAVNGHRPYLLDTMLRIHCMQHWYNLSNCAMEEALYEIASMRLFAKLSLDQAIPDRTTIMNFRHLLEQHQLALQLFDAVNQWLCDAGYMVLPTQNPSCCLCLNSEGVNRPLFPIHEPTLLLYPC